MPVPSPSRLDALRFDPAKGTVVREPPGIGYGYWAGGHKVFFDEEGDRLVLFYRERTPLEKGRGGRCAVAVSHDGTSFRDVWSATKEEFAASSIEVGHCVRDPAGEWRLYVSYEVEPGHYWRIDVIRAGAIEELSTQSRRTVLLPFDYWLRSLKDPVVYIQEGQYRVYMAGPSRTPPVREGNVVHAAPLDSTLLGISDDGLYFPELRFVFEAPATDTWDGRRARINSLIPMDGGYVALYDGGRTAYDNYEEWCGLAWSPDGIEFERLPSEEPWVRSPYGCVRYVYAVRVRDEILFYYEFTREDGSHDLRCSRVPLPA
jgi:hypothetical protein